MVIVVPGSLGLGPNHLAHAAAIIDLGFAGYGTRGAHIGGTPESASLFVDDMTAFWLDTLSPTPE